jgi:molybdopterin-biosynthesis enzyme MoeA-like protein
VTQKTAIIFCIGRELLEGLVLDRNAHFLAGRLNDLGVRVLTIQVLDDVEDDLVQAFTGALARKPSYVLTTGGMGPGNDDLTRQTVAKATGRALKPDPRAQEMLSKAYRRLFAMGVVESPELTEGRKKMARLPEGGVPYESPIGVAPGIRLDHGPTRIFLMAGVPDELRQLFNVMVAPTVIGDGGGEARDARHLEYFGRDESALESVFLDLERRYPGVQGRARVQGTEEDIVIRITLTGEHARKEELKRLLDLAEADLRTRLGMETGRQRREQELEGE